MTTYAYKIVLNDTEAIALKAALDMFIEHCEEKLNNGPRAPYWAQQRAAQRILKKLYLDTEQTSENNFIHKTE
jgi:hypothetical protein